MTLQQFIKNARKLPDKIVLQHAFVFHEATENPEGAVKRGKNNPQMRDLRRRGYFILDKKSVSHPGWDPTWYITYAGRSLLVSSTESKQP